MRRCLLSEARNLGQLEVFIAVVKFMEANFPSRWGTPGSQFVDPWIEETFIWILAAFVHG